jgi:hypothetical protein
MNNRIDIETIPQIVKSREDRLEAALKYHTVNNFSKVMACKLASITRATLERLI